MQYVIKCDSGYYGGPSTGCFVANRSYWKQVIDEATVFHSAKQAKDMYNNLKKIYPDAWFGIFEYNPPTLGKIVISEKETLIEDLKLIKDEIESGDIQLGGVIKGIPRTINSVIKFIERNVND